MLDDDDDGGHVARVRRGAWEVTRAVVCPGLEFSAAWRASIPLEPLGGTEASELELTPWSQSLVCSQLSCSLPPWETLL